jgi:hypothetical protein
MRWLVLLVVLSGCAGTRGITDLQEFLPEAEAQLVQHRTVDSVLHYYFTDEAYAAIKDIPLIDGPAFSGYAAGTTFLSNVASFVSFNGWGRKVIVPSDLLHEWGVAAIIHEYVHHIDDMTRDGELDLIDLEAFRKAFLLLERDFKYAWIAINANRMVGEYPIFYDTLFSIGPLSERLAYTADQMAANGKGPAYMRIVLSRVLRASILKRWDKEQR